MAADDGRLTEFLHRFVGDLGATIASSIVVGDRLGLYRALADRPLRPHGRAERTGTAAFQLAIGALKGKPEITRVFRGGEGLRWHEHDPDVFVGCERFAWPGYGANLVSSWLPALEGLEEKLRAGIRVADVGWGHGAYTILMAQAFPNSTFMGSDHHGDSIDEARKRAEGLGIGGRC